MRKIELKEDSFYGYGKNNRYLKARLFLHSVFCFGFSSVRKDLESDREKIMKYLTNLRDFKGVGSRGFNEVGDGIKDVYVDEIKGGRWVFITSK
jgi:hypothetical protein